MNILHISPSYYPAFKYGGPIQSVHLLNKYLVKKGLKVDVLTTSAGIEKKDSIKLNEWNVVDKCRVKYLNYFGYEHYNFSLSFINEVRKIIDGYELIHITAVWNFPVLVGSIFSILKNKPYLISPRGALAGTSIQNKSVLIKKMYFKSIASYYLKHSSALHFTTNVERDESLRSLNHRIKSFVIPNGIDLKEIENSHHNNSSKNSESEYILFVGRIHKIKGLDLLIDSLKEILNENLILIIAGPDEYGYKSQLDELIKKCGIDNYCKFIGEVKKPDLWELYRNAKIFILPSYSESFGMSSVEAMACGTPVIITNKVGIHKEVEQNEAGIIAETNVGSIRSSIQKLLDDSNLREKISINGQKMVKEYYNIEQVADQMIEQYKKILWHTSAS